MFLIYLTCSLIYFEYAILQVCISYRLFVKLTVVGLAVANITSSSVGGPAP